MGDQEHEGGGVRIDAMRRVAESGRAAIREVWSRRDDRDAMEPQMRKLLDILEQHKHFRPYWEGADPEDETNPFLHVVYHQVMREQVASGDPPETSAALGRLAAAGVDPHEAEHRVMEILITEMFEMLSKRSPFDRERYRQRLAAI